MRSVLPTVAAAVVAAAAPGPGVTTLTAQTVPAHAARGHAPGAHASVPHASAAQHAPRRAAIDTLPTRRTPAFPEGWQLPTGAPATTAAHGMIASNSALASAAGVEILRHGGNAVDAAVATGFALAVTYPVAGNIGGGGFMVIHFANGRSAALDYREVAPAAATRTMYLEASGEPTDGSRVGPLAVGVPGAVAGLTAALAKYGRLPLATVMAPAIRLAVQGFAVDTPLMRSLRSDSAKLARYASDSPFMPGGRPLVAGTVVRQPELARTLRRIARRGAAGFYRGETATALADEMHRGGGLVTARDLAAYHPIWRTPLRTTYRGYGVLGMPPVSSGGTTSFEILHILEAYTHGRGDTLPTFGGAQYAHLIAEAERRAFVDRNSKLCDPAFCRPPVAELTSKAYARHLASTIDPERATPTTTVSTLPDRTHTTHYAVVDAAGNAVSTTTTLNLGYGSGVFVRGAGFFLNDEMDDFAAAPGKPNAFGLIEGEQNAVQAGKRPLSSMTPSVVLDRAGRTLLVVGAAGGPTIISGTTQVILNVLDHRMSLADAMRAPRLHHQALPDTLFVEASGLTTAARDSLAAMGHAVGTRSRMVNVNAVMRVRGGWQGVSEPRASGAAAGY